MADAKKTVLIVDDDVGVRGLLEGLLTRAGYTAVPITTAETTWDLMQLWRPDALIVDIGLPGMDGWKLVSLCRGDPGFADLPILAISGGEFEAGVIERSGCSAFVAKPFEPRQILEWLEQSLA